MKAFDYVYFHKTVQDAIRQKAFHTNAWFLDNITIPDFSLITTNNIPCFYKNKIFNLKDATNDDGIAGFTVDDLDINKLLKTPLEKNYSGGRIKDVYQLSDFIDITIVQKLFTDNPQCHELSFHIAVTNEYIYGNITYDDELFVFKSPQDAINTV